MAVESAEALDAPEPEHSPPAAAGDAVSPALSGRSGPDNLQTAWFRDLIRDYTVLWVAGPALAQAIDIGEHRTSSARTTAPAYARHWATLMTARRGARIVRIGGTLFSFDHPNPMRTLEPLMRQRGGAHGAEPTRIRQRMHPRVLRRWTAEARRTAKELTVRARDAKVPVNDATIVEFVLGSARALARADAVLSSPGIRSVVLGTQHASTARALIHIARVRGIPTVYFPHAPVADAPQYRDLPTDYVGLRGQGEVDYYRPLGVQGALPVVGNPTFESRYPETLDVGGRPVYAVSPHVALSAETALVRTLHCDIDVCLHPEIDPAHEYCQREFPANWRIHCIRTVDALAEGPPCVIQSSSGVAWEALHHGIPTIQLSPPGRTNLYPFIREPHVPFARDTDELSGAVRRARESAGDLEHRRRLCEWASYWCSSTGAQAVAACNDVIDVAEQDGPSAAPLLDGWRE